MITRREIFRDPATGSTLVVVPDYRGGVRFEVESTKRIFVFSQRAAFRLAAAIIAAIERGDAQFTEPPG